MGTQLNTYEFRQLCDGVRTIYLAFDADANGSGQHATETLTRRLGEQGLRVCAIELPKGHDPEQLFRQRR
jgi:DNA primase